MKYKDNITSPPPPLIKPSGLGSSEDDTDIPSNSPKQLLSVVIPCYNEADGLAEFYAVLNSECADHPDLDYEFIFINDGSSDGTQQVLEGLAISDPRVVVVEFSRNFGKEAALSAGLAQTRGDLVVPIDADLQHPPKVIFELVERFEQGDADVVIARRNSRHGESALYRFCTGLFYKIEDAVSDCHMPRDAGDFRLMSRRVVQALNNLPEKRRFMKGLYAWVGFKTAYVSYDVAQRQSGESKFSAKRLISLALNGILDFSTMPLRVWAAIGTVISFISFLSALWIIISTIFFGIKTPGYASLMVSVVFFGGVQLISIGILGEYIGRVYGEVKSRPAYVVRQIIRGGKAEE